MVERRLVVCRDPARVDAYRQSQLGPQPRNLAGRDCARRCAGELPWRRQPFVADAEIRRAQEQLARVAPNPGTGLFAYPYGQSNEYLVQEYLPRFGRAMGLRAAFGDWAGYVHASSDRWNLPRFVFGRDWKSPAELRTILERTA